MKKVLKVFALCTVLVGLLVAAGCGAKQDQPNQATPKQETPQAANQPVLKIGTEAAYAPFESFDNKTNEIVGFDAEFITAVADAMGMKAQLNHTEWTGLVPSLNTGQVNVVISAMTITDERKKEVNFSDPYFQAQQIIAVKEGSPVKGLKDLIGKPVGVQGNTTGQYALEKYPGFNKDDIKPYPTTPNALENLINGSVQAVVADGPVVLNYIKTNPDAKLTTVTDKFEKEFYGVAIKKGNDDLLKKVNQAIKKVKDSGKYQEIYNKYFGK